MRLIDRDIDLPGTSRSRTGSVCWIAVACGWALITVAAGCGSSNSPISVDAGMGGHGGSGTGGHATGFGGSTPGVGGAGMGGMVAGMGGAGVGGDTGTGGATDAGPSDTINICADAGGEGGPGDRDNDGTPDCLDGCPDDPIKIFPGLCGCGVSGEGDVDGDGVPDCFDRCPGSPDVDTDHDGTLDCFDGCPKDPSRLAPGLCGCGGIPDSTPLCLVHRYSFDDTTATIADSITIAGVSPANGTAMGGAIPAAGKITLAGGASTQIGAQFVSLPSGIISAVGINATFEAWVTWTPGAVSNNWQRIFDFGNSDQPAGTPGVGQTYLFLSPSNGGNSLLRAAITLASGGASEDVTDGTGSLPANPTTPTHVALVVDGSNKRMTLYVNGAANGTPVTLRNGAVLGVLKDTNNWLGRSQWAPDGLFAGSISEFRVYSAVLSANQINASFTAGPDVVPAAVDGGVLPPPDGGTTTPDAGADAPAGQ